MGAKVERQVEQHERASYSHHIHINHNDLKAEDGGDVKHGLVIRHDHLNRSSSRRHASKHAPA
jgi:hypothetical protein